jgi:Ran GTPase-activating protein (RanGAP) involved in mRNA processing and transport
MSDANDLPLSPNFLEFCAKVRHNDPSFLPEHGEPLVIRSYLSENEDIELADALQENANVTYLELDTENYHNYTEGSAEAMAKCFRSNKHLHHIFLLATGSISDQKCKEIICCFLPAIQESMSLKKLSINLPLIGESSNLALENMLTHTQSLQSLTLLCPNAHGGERDVAAFRSGLQKNITLRELTLVCRQGGTHVDTLSSLLYHPLLQRLCLRGYAMDLTELETVLLSDGFKITDLEIHKLCSNTVGLPNVLKALAQRVTLTKLTLKCCPLSRDEARLLGMVLCNTPSLHALVLHESVQGSAELADLAPALYLNTSIRVLDMSDNSFIDMESAEIFGRILRYNMIITTLDLSSNAFGRTTGAMDCIAKGLGSNSTLLKIDLSTCFLRDGDVSALTQPPGSRNTTLQKVSLGLNNITSAGVAVLLGTMEQSSHITDLDFQYNSRIGKEGASLLARSLGKNALPNLTRLSLQGCGVGDDGVIMLVSALEQNTSLLQLDLRDNAGVSMRAFSALAESLPKIKVLQGVDFTWCTGLASVMPLLLTGLRKNTSLFRFHVTGCAPSFIPPQAGEAARCAGGWMQEMERLGHRNRCLHSIRALEEWHPPRGVWLHALARVATLPDVIFEGLRSKPNLVTSEGEAAKDTEIS